MGEDQAAIAEDKRGGNEAAETTGDEGVDGGKADEADSIHSDPELFRTQLIGLVGDLDSVIGFLLGGIGEKTIKPPVILQEWETNVFIVDKDTEVFEIEEVLRNLLRRSDIGMIFITRLVAEQIRTFLAHRGHAYPIILEIPSPLDPFEFEAEGDQCRRKNLAVRKK